MGVGFDPLMLTSGGVKTQPNWDGVSGKPTTFAPAAHKSSHETGGADALSPADIGAAVAGAAPAAHKSSHETGGADALTPAGIGAAPALLTKTVEIAVLDWSGTTAVKTVSGVLPASLLWISPVPASYDAYALANIRATAQGTNSITFECVNVPAVAVNVNVIIGSL